MNDDLDLLQRFNQAVEGEKEGASQPQINRYSPQQIQEEITKLQQQIGQLAKCRDNADLLKSAPPKDRFTAHIGSQQGDLYGVTPTPTKLPKVTNHAHSKSIHKALVRICSPCFEVELRKHGRPSDSPTPIPHVTDPLHAYRHLCIATRDLCGAKPCSNPPIHNFAVEITARIRNCITCHLQKNQDARTTALNIDQEIERITGLIQRLGTMV